MGHPIAKLNPAHKGMLHRDLGFKQGTPLPISALMEAKHSKNPAVRKRANFAIVSRKWNHGGK